MTDYKQLCVELLSELENAIRVIHAEDGTRHISGAYPVLNKAKNTLTEPESEQPTDEELRQLRREREWPVVDSVLFAIVRAVLTRWGK